MHSANLELHLSPVPVLLFLRNFSQIVTAAQKKVSWKLTRCPKLLRKAVICTFWLQPPLSILKPIFVPVHARKSLSFILVITGRKMYKQHCWPADISLRECRRLKDFQLIALLPRASCGMQDCGEEDHSWAVALNQPFCDSLSDHSG